MVALVCVRHEEPREPEPIAPKSSTQPNRASGDGEPRNATHIIKIQFKKTAAQHVLCYSIV